MAKHHHSIASRASSHTREVSLVLSRIYWSYFIVLVIVHNTESSARQQGCSNGVAALSSITGTGSAFVRSKKKAIRSGALESGPCFKEKTKMKIPPISGLTGVRLVGGATRPVRNSRALQAFAFRGQDCGIIRSPGAFKYRHRKTMGKSILRAESTSSLLSSTTQQQIMGFDYKVDVTESDYRQVLVAPNVPCAKELRQFYDNFYKDPREPSSKRFVWDPWVVQCSEGKSGNEAPLPGDLEDEELEPHQQLQPPVEGEREAAGRQVQYSLKRAPCSDFFYAGTPEEHDLNEEEEEATKTTTTTTVNEESSVADSHLLSEENDLYEQLIDEISELGRSIGCTSITPPWISMYTHGDVQNLHIDSSHGPMAYVLSLTNDDDYGRAFVGGETLLLQPRILQYWNAFGDHGGKEAPTIMRYIPPKFGRCIAFDGRVPHGVNQIQGSSIANDPRHARIVIHGWFAEPEICWLGSDTNEFVSNEDGKQEEAMEVLEKCMVPMMDLLSETDIGRVVGYLALRITIDADGTVDAIDAVCDTLQSDPSDFRGVIGEDVEGRPIIEDACADIRLTLHENLSNLNFPSTKTGGVVVVPFDFV